jgi:hypothetical protein
MTAVAMVARRKLADAVGAEEGHRGARFQAGMRLLQEFQALAASFKMTTDQGRNACSVFLFGKLILVEVDASSGQVMVARDFAGPGGGALQREYVSLVFNPLDGTLEGKDIEHEVAPEPGRLMPRKSALTALVEQVVDLAKR